MSSNYPGAVDTFEANTDWTGDPNAAPATARIAAADMNNVQDSVHNTQATLGVNPQGSYATVKDRLDALAAGGGAGALTERGNWTTITGYSVSDVVTQTGIRYVCRVGHTSGTFATDLTANKWVALDASGTTAGGDLSGTLPNPTVAKVNGVAVTGTPTSGQVITATSGTAATWQTPSGGGGGAVSSVVGQTGAVTGTQILADTTVAAALTAKADASATTTALAGKLATTAGAVGTTNLADGSVTAVKVAADVATQAELDAAIAGLTGTYGRLWSFTAKTGAYTAAGWEFVLANAASAGFTVTLPSAPAAGTLVAVKKTDSSGNVVTVAPQGGALLDGDANGTIVSEDAGAVFGWDGAAWRTVAVQQALNAPSVTSVAGKTGTVTLVAADITDLAGLLAAKVGTSRAITAGTGLTGGGDLSADRTLAVTYGSTAGTAAQGNDSRLSDSRTPSGSAGGDLSGTYPNPAVAKLQGTAVSGTAPTSGQYLRFDGTSWVPATAPGASALGFFGDGSDGAVTVSTTVNLSRDMYYDTLVVASGGTLNPNGWRIYCKTSCDVQSGGTVAANGSGGGTGSTGGTAHINTSSRAVRVAASGHAGAAGGTGVGAMPTGVPAVLGGFGGGGGNGGSGAAVTTQGGTTLAAAGVTGERTAPHCFTGTLQYAAATNPERAVVTLGTGGGSGSGDGTNSGGGGGGGGGVVILNARTLNVSGTVTAAGGAGKAPTTGNCGGGGGGGGGVIYLNSVTRTGSGTVSAAGGAGGAGTGTGTAGSSGAAGFILDTAWA